MGAEMGKRKAPPPVVFDSQREILDGVDAIGTIVDEDLRYLRERLAETLEFLGQLKRQLNEIQVEVRAISHNQGEQAESLTLLANKLDHLEIRLIEGLQDRDRDSISRSAPDRPEGF